jgi:cellulose synthase/poly-beta-1,6-N-acetylglucosamine synthase-like glycosyltransferase
MSGKIGPMELFSDIFVYSLLFLTLYFEVFLLVTYIEERKTFTKAPPHPRRPGNYPAVTIIVPAWNESKTIGGTLRSLLALDYPKDRLSIFIVNDGSTDNTLEVAGEYVNNPQVRLFTKENGGKHTAFNLGLTHVTSQLVGCLDADSFVERSALKEMIPYFDNSEVMAVTPSVQIHNPGNLIQKMHAAEYMMGEFTRKVFSRINGLYVTPGPFSIYRKSVFDQIGGFIHAYNTEDMEMALRMQSYGMKIENAHTAFVYTVAPNSLLALYRQRVRWVSGFLKNTFFNYRHMFFSKKYGNLGLLTMPFAFISIFIALFFSAAYAQNIASMIYQKYVKYSALGFQRDWGWPTFNFDWFSINLEFRMLVIYAMIVGTIFFLLVGTRMVIKTNPVNRSSLYFLLFYGLIAPFWLVKSLYNLVTAKESPWR